MPKNIIIIACYVIMAAVIPYLLITNRITLKKMGECVLKLPRKSIAGVIVIDVIALVLPAILIIRDFRNMNYVFAACSILAYLIMTKDGFNRKNYGVYQNGLIAPSAVVFYEDIIGFPVLELPPEEQENYSKNTLVLVTKKSSHLEIFFSSEKECREVLEQLRQIGIIHIS